MTRWLQIKKTATCWLRTLFSPSPSLKIQFFHVNSWTLASTHKHIIASIDCEEKILPFRIRHTCNVKVKKFRLVTYACVIVIGTLVIWTNRLSILLVIKISKENKSLNIYFLGFMSLACSNSSFELVKARRILFVRSKLIFALHGVRWLLI